VRSSGPIRAVVAVASDVTPDAVAVIDRGDLAIGAIRAGDPQAALEGPHVVTIEMTAPHAGRFAFVIGYVTDRIKWDAAYVWTTTPARTHVTLTGELAIHDRAGLGWAGADVTVVDALRRATIGAATDVRSRALGRYDISSETRVPLVSHTRASPLRAVLVFDPNGDVLDRPSKIPSRDSELGGSPSDAPLSESYEVPRDARETAGLPEGLVKLVEEHRDGARIVIGETQLFAAAASGQASDTIAVGTAGDVHARRERLELAIDDDDRRIVEEFAITFDSTRRLPVRVIAREHMPRGVDWNLAYYSVPDAIKEGAQQVALRATIPPHGHLKIGYVVVYVWDTHR
jgi:hypothetical protein